MAKIGVGVLCFREPWKSIAVLPRTAQKLTQLLQGDFNVRSHGKEFRTTPAAGAVGTYIWS